jgi:hypothetical protein
VIAACVLYRHNDGAGVDPASPIIGGNVLDAVAAAFAI